jgi:hypothetical protein
LCTQRMVGTMISLPRVFSSKIALLSAASGISRDAFVLAPPAAV